LLLGRCRPALLRQGLDESDRLDIGGDFLLWRARADPMLGQDAEILLRPLAAVRSLVF
jgi:hypothetical protein